MNTIHYLLDTNICIYLIKKRPLCVLEKLNAIPFGTVAISSITIAELYFGIEKSQYPAKNHETLQKFLYPLEILTFDESAAACYGKIRSVLEKQGTPIGPLDLMIAAHAKSMALTLVSNNTKEFARVPDLLLENWAIIAHR